MSSNIVKEAIDDFRKAYLKAVNIILKKYYPEENPLTDTINFISWSIYDYTDLVYVIALGEYTLYVSEGSRGFNLSYDIIDLFAYFLGKIFYTSEYPSTTAYIFDNLELKMSLEEFELFVKLHDYDI